MQYKAYSIKEYFNWTRDKIQNEYQSYTLDEFIRQLNIDNYYNIRILPDDKVILFGDLDHYTQDIDTFIDKMTTFLLEKYAITLSKDDFKFTKSNKESHEQSYHYSIPKYYSTAGEMKKIISEFMQYTNYTKENIDLSVYSNHFFRMPNQSKGKCKTNDNPKNAGVHKIIHGDTIDFIVHYIPQDSTYIQSIHSQSIQIERKKTNTREIIVNNTAGNEQSFSNNLGKTFIYKNLFDHCYKQERFENYDNWITIGMCIRNSFDDNTGFELFNYFSSKGSNYEGLDKTKNVYYRLIKQDTSNGYTCGTIFFYAQEDNKPKYIEIISKNEYELGQTDMCKYLKMLAGKKFVYQQNENIFKLYCYNGRYWEQNNNEFRRFLSNELYEFLKRILIEVYWNSRDFHKLKSQIEKLKTVSLKRDIEETYREYNSIKDLKFDNKWNLFGFNNTVYDLRSQSFREYNYDDYIHLTSGYDYREPTQQEIHTMNTLIQQIMPDPNERNFLIQIMSTSLEGRCLEHFVILNGCGGNGKSLLNDILLRAIGKHSLICNNSLLFEANRTGSNPEKANIHKKRLIIFREPSSKFRFNNGTIKEMTGSGMFSARGHHESQTEKVLHNTTFVECNERPNFEDDPTQAEVRRVIDIYFPSLFTLNKDIVDHSKNIYLANTHYKTDEFQEKHKFAFFHILIEAYKDYAHNDYQVQIPQSIKTRTQEYLDKSRNIKKWFDEHYEKVDDDKQYLKLNDLYSKFRFSDSFNNFTKTEKRKYNKTYFYNFFQRDPYLRRFYFEQKRINDTNVRSVLISYVVKREN